MEQVAGFLLLAAWIVGLSILYLRAKRRQRRAAVEHLATIAEIQREEFYAHIARRIRLEILEGGRKSTPQLSAEQVIRSIANSTAR